VRCFVGKISRTLFLTRDSPATLLDGSVLRREASHLLLIRTNLGYGTVSMAACARQGCSATERVKVKVNIGCPLPHFSPVYYIEDAFF
jgi:hypothetical protein